MSHVHPLLEAEDMPVDFLPRDALPGHLQRASLRFGTVPLTHPFTFHDTGPTSADPGHYPGPWLLLGHPPPAWHTVGTCSEK